jgi:hypothetical protein
MSADEASTVRTLSTFREITASLIKQDRRRVVETSSDNVLTGVAGRVNAAKAQRPADISPWVVPLSPGGLWNEE